MRLALVVIVAAVCSGTAYAQSSAASTPMKGYVEANAQSSFGNVTSQSYGGEIGVNLNPALQIFVEGGQTRNVATADISSSALKFAGGLGAGFSVKQPVTFGVAGVRYLIRVSGSRALPYILAGGGAAKVEQQATFTVNGVDVTNNLAQFGATLGTDLSGSFTKPMMVVGGGVALPIWRQVVIDFQVRYGRVFAEDEGINITRAGIGFGVRF
jgi:opacity protein-like surface antigen